MIFACGRIVNKPKNLMKDVSLTFSSVNEQQLASVPEQQLTWVFSRAFLYSLRDLWWGGRDLRLAHANCSSSAVPSACDPLPFVSLEFKLSMTGCVFSVSREWPCCVTAGWVLRDDNQLNVANSWLNPTIPLIHAVFELKLCNRGMSLSHTSKLNGCRELFATACSDFAAACLVFLIACGLAANPWFFFSCAGVLWPDLSACNHFHVQLCLFKLLRLHGHKTRTSFCHFSQTVDRIDLKLGEHVPTIIMHLP